MQGAGSWDGRAYVLAATAFDKTNLVSQKVRNHVAIENLLTPSPRSDIVIDDNDLRRSLPDEELAVEEKRLILGERGL